MKSKSPFKIGCRFKISYGALNSMLSYESVLDKAKFMQLTPLAIHV